MKNHFRLFLSFLIISIPTALPAAESAMNNSRLNTLIARIDAKPAGQIGYWQIKYQGIPVYIITSEKANRMRIISPIVSSKNIDKEKLYRMMQANFDTALDARYSIAQGKLWSAFIHPLHELSDEQFFSGLAQTITLVKSYGKSYSSGALIFQGGDSKDLNNKTYQDVLKKGLKI